MRSIHTHVSKKYSKLNNHDKELLCRCKCTRAITIIKTQKYLQTFFTIGVNPGYSQKLEFKIIAKVIQEKPLHTSYSVLTDLKNVMQRSSHISYRLSHFNLYLCICRTFSHEEQKTAFLHLPSAMLNPQVEIKCDLLCLTDRSLVRKNI